MKNMNTIEKIICLSFLFLIIIFVLLLINSNRTKNPSTINNKIDYEIIDNDKYGRMHMRGFYIENVSDGIDVIIGMGSKNTGGYSITLDKIIMEDDELVIYVNESSPKPTDIVTQAFTYPTLKVKVLNNTDNIKVVNQNGTIFKRLN